MDILLWIFQFLLAFVFIYHGWLMLALPEPTEQARLSYIRAIPVGLRWFTGTAELLGGVGLVLPWLTGLLPRLTSLAAGGLCMLLVGAITFHIHFKEYANIVFNLTLLALAFLIASERFV